MLRLRHALVVLGLSLGVVACGGAPSGADGGTDAGVDAGVQRTLTSLGTVDDGTVVAEFLAEKPLAVGLNRVAYRLSKKSDGSAITRAAILQEPLMTMPMHSHTCPETDPAGVAEADGVFLGKINFNMAGGADGTWSNTVKVTPEGDTTQHTLTFPNLSVAASTAGAMMKFNDGTADVYYILSLNNEKGWKPGPNQYLLAVHHRQSLMAFPPVSDLTITATLAEGTGTPADVAAPTYGQDGEYAGTLHMPTAGNWKVTFTFKRGDTVLGTTSWTLQL